MEKPTEKEDKPTKYFMRKIAGLVLKGRLGRAQRELARWNSGRKEQMRLLPTEEERIAWAKSVLGEAGPTPESDETE